MPAQRRSPALTSLELPAHGSMEALGRLITRYPEGALLDLAARKASFGRQSAGELLRALRHGEVRTDPAHLAHTAWFYLALDPSPARLAAAAALLDQASA